MKWRYFAAACLIGLLLWPGQALAQADEAWPGLEGAVEEQLAGLELQALEQYFDALAQKPPWLESVHDFLMQAAGGQAAASPESWLNLLGTVAFGAVGSGMPLLAQVIALALFSALLHNLSEGLGGESAKAAQMVCRAAIMLLLVSSAFTFLAEAGACLESMKNFAALIFPILTALTATIGAVASSAAFQPLAAFAMGAAIELMHGGMLPVIRILLCVNALDSLSERVQLGQLAKLITCCLKWALGCFLTVFTGAVAVQGILTPVADGVSLRTARYAVDSLIPVVGGMFSKTMDTIWASAALVKNGVGALGLLTVAWLCLLPAARILAGILLYRMAAALLQPADGSKAAGMISGAADALTMLLAVVLSAGLMLFLLIAVFVSAGNTLLSMR